MWRLSTVAGAVTIHLFVKRMGKSAPNKVSSLCLPFVILVRVTIQFIDDAVVVAVAVVFIWSFIIIMMNPMQCANGMCAYFLPLAYAQNIK